MGYGDRSEMTWTFTVSRSFYVVVGQYCCGASYTVLYFAFFASIATRMTMMDDGPPHHHHHRRPQPSSSSQSIILSSICFDASAGSNIEYSNYSTKIHTLLDSEPKSSLISPKSSLCRHSVKRLRYGIVLTDCYSYVPFFCNSRHTSLVSPTASRRVRVRVIPFSLLFVRIVAIIIIFVSTHRHPFYFGRKAVTNLAPRRKDYYASSTNASQ